MFNTPVEVPDRISTLELSKLWLYKAMQSLEQELQAEGNQEPEADDEDDDR
jgi:hypothetical protein